MYRLGIACLIALLLSGCDAERAAQPAALPTDSVLKMLYANIDSHFDGYVLLDRTIQETGNRLTGTESGRKAENLVFKALSEYGLDQVSFDAFEVVAWQRGEISLQLDLGGGFQHFPAVTLAHSPVAADVQAPIVDLGNGLAEDYARIPRSAIEGKMVLVNIGLLDSKEGQKNLHRSEKAALAIQAGAAGIIMVNTVEGRILLTGTASSTGDMLTVPAVCITLEDAQTLRKARSARAKIQMTNTSGPITARNVIARWQGHSLPGERIVIGGHLDSWDLSQGAIDNGLGAFTIVDVARTFAQVGQRPKRTVEFVLFMGEEQGLLGSKHFVQRSLASGGLDSIRYMINLDMMGNPNGFSISGRPEMKEMMQGIGEKLKQVDTVFSNLLNEGVGLHSDHQPFMLQGIPVMGLMSNLDPAIYKFYHSDGDAFPLVDPNHMKNGAKFTAMMLYALADADSIPARRQSDQEIRDFLLKHNLREPLELRREWRWND